MSHRAGVKRLTAIALATTVCAAAQAPPAAAFSPIKPVCMALGWVSGIAGKACAVAQHAGKLLKGGKQLLTGHLGGAVKTVLGGGGGGGSTASTALGLAAIGTWVLGGAKSALHETASVLGKTTSPELGTTWFSSAYWRIAGISAVLTLPFLFAACVQALMRSDLALLARAALGYLPLAFLAVSVAAPLTMLLLSASDQLSAVVASAGGGGGTRFLALAGGGAGLLSLLHGSAFLVFLVALFTAAGAIVLWLELLVREAAVYVVVLMLPLAFAALVWPARRVWAIRAVELLVALILSKFAIVAVISLGGAALGHGGAGGLTGMIAGFVLVVLGAFAPWALLRLLPLAELASSAAGSLRGGSSSLRTGVALAEEAAGADDAWAARMTAGMRHQAEEASGAGTSHNGAAAAEAERLAALATVGGPPPRPTGDAAGIGAADGSSDRGARGASPPPAADTADDFGLTPSHARPSGSDDADPGVPAGSTDRLPGMGPMWQAPDLSWRPLTLGPEDGWPPPAPWPADGAQAPEPDDPGQGRQITDGAGDDHDPLPPGQDPDEGRL